MRPSLAAPAGTVTVTSLPPSGVTASRYAVALTGVNVPLAAPATSMSPTANPVTSSENVNVTVSSAVALILAGTPAMSSVGTEASQAAVLATALAGPVLRPSLAASCRTVTTTSVLPAGVMSSV